MKRSSKDAKTEPDHAMAKNRTKRNVAQTEAETTTKDEAAMDRDRARYGKEQILGSSRYRGQRDLVSALLEEGKRYSLEEVDGLLKDYLKGKVM